MSKKSKRIKIINNTEEILKGFKKIDPEVISKALKKRAEEEKKQYQKDLAKYKKDIKAEEKRVTNLGCPVCKSTKKNHNTIYEQRTEPVVYGGRNSPSRKLADYYICQGCGVMYVDINRKEIIHPTNPESSFRFL